MAFLRKILNRDKKEEIEDDDDGDDIMSYLRRGGDKKKKQQQEVFEYVEGRLDPSQGVADLTSFDDNLKKHETLPLHDFKMMYPEHDGGEGSYYLPGVSYDPTQSRFFDMFQDSKKRPKNEHHRYQDNFALNQDQLNLFKKNGFVVCDPVGDTWSREYYRLFNNDLPVFITTDSILHALHMSYDNMLKELETTFFTTLLSNIMQGMREELKKASAEYTSGPLVQAFQDVDFFLTVGSNLLASEVFTYIGEGAPSVAKKPDLEAEKNKRLQEIMGGAVPERPKADQKECALGRSDKDVTQALKACCKEESTTLSLFGTDREIDFTLMKPRGHYTKTAELRKYFRTMTWLGIIDMKVAGKGSSTRSLCASVVLVLLMHRRSQDVRRMFGSFNQMLDSLVGAVNSMTIPQLEIILSSSSSMMKGSSSAAATASTTTAAAPSVEFNKSYFESLNSEDGLVALQKEIMNTEFGVKGYNAEAAESFGAGKAEMPRSFTFMGKRFALDGWAMSKVVADQVFWNGEKVLRKRTSSVEVAYSIFGNTDAVPILTERMTAPKSEKDRFRDGLPYHHNLLAVKETVDQLNDNTWFSSVHMSWLRMLRSLSEPIAKDPRYPQSMRTKAYAMKRLTSQLGSWSQLRHDNLLYVDQPRSFACGCSYPAGFVEPFVGFWSSVEDVCMSLKSALTKTEFPDIPPQNNSPFNWQKETLANVKQREIDFLNKFARTVRMLRDISEKELQSQPLDDQQETFLRTVMEGAGFMSGMSRWSGWYCELFYGGYGFADKKDLIVSDVFTDGPDPRLGDEGCVLHMGLGRPRTMYISIDNGGDTCTYAGPVYNLYEFEMPGLQRLNDKEWKGMVKGGKMPPKPDWTKSYIASSK
eukprot:TRINITY_DN279_c1_g2_i7.p1 TRINITY_DN279_c1_g2~~TRINITY_DN279_c1_g2_i7.p1  ORF type:complete len:870 (-),score=157.22 TRINITY_DN279_c1_g2_i7:63-2672(-)